jgi:hypothetical protein
MLSTFSHVVNSLHQWNILSNTFSTRFQHVFNKLVLFTGFLFTYFTYLWRHSIHVLSTRFMHFYNMFSAKLKACFQFVSCATMKLQTSYLIFLSISPDYRAQTARLIWLKYYPTFNFKYHNSCGNASVDWGGGEATLCAHFCDSQFLPSYWDISVVFLALPFVTKFKIDCWSRFFGGPLDDILIVWMRLEHRQAKYSLF